MNRLVRRQKAETKRMTEAGLRKAARERLRALRARIGELRVERRERLQEIRAKAKANVQRYRERIAELRAELRAVIAAKREEIQSSRLAAFSTRAAMDKAIHAAVREWADERQVQLEVRRAEGRTRKAQASRISMKERRAEGDDEVRNNLDAELLPVWDAVKSKIRATERKSRTEAFLQWAHDHPADVQHIIAQHAETEADREWFEMLAEEEELKKALAGRGSSKLRKLASSEGPPDDAARSVVDAFSKGKRKPSKKQRDAAEFRDGYSSADHTMRTQQWTIAEAKEHLAAVKQKKADDGELSPYDAGFAQRVREALSGRDAPRAPSIDEDPPF